MNVTTKMLPDDAVVSAGHLQSIDACDVPGVELRVMRSAAEVERIRGIWSGWPSHRDSEIDFCLEFGWTRKEVVRPHVIVLYRQGQPEAMAVGWIERTQMRSQIGYLKLPGLPAQLLNFSYGGFLGNLSAENSEELIRSIMGALRSGEADVAGLDHLSIGSPLHSRALAASGFATRDHFVQPDPHNVMVLPTNVDELYKGFSQGLRAEVRRKKKKLLADFGESVVIRCYRQADEVEEACPLLEEVAKGTYQRGLGVGFRDSEEMRRRLRFCARKGWLRIYVLTIAGKPCAFWIGTLYNGSFLSDYNSYDPQYRNYSLGTYLLISVVEEFCKEGVQNIDFGFGPAEYKERFGNTMLMESSVYIFAPKLKGLVLNTIRTTTCSVDAAVKKVLERTKLLPRIKRLWRERAAKTTPHS
jgi:hypothetical protein